MKRPPNILLIAIDSLRRDRMSGYGFDRLTTPHIDAFAADATLYEETLSPHVPTTPAYASMLTGRDCFGTEVVALRHQGGLTEKVKTLPEILRESGYTSTCVGFTGNPSSRGFDHYLDYKAWGGRDDGVLRKAEALNEVTLPELERLSGGDQPWMMMLRHMDPHSPYLPPPPFDRAFYQDDEFSGEDTMKPVFDFKPFADYFRSWMPPGVKDRHYIDAQYDGAVAYMDVCIAQIFEKLRQLGIYDETIVVLNGDHGETLYEHECWYDHHGLYEHNLVVPLIIRYPGKVEAGRRVPGLNHHKDLVPTLLELAEIESDLPFDGRSLTGLAADPAGWAEESECYLTECTWMRKHGWRTRDWKLIVALEPDFHFKPEVELYHLGDDPLEEHNLAEEKPDVVADLRSRMEAFIARREADLEITNPMLTQGSWHKCPGIEAFSTSQEAYDHLHIGDASAARKLQARDAKPSAG